MLVYDIARPMSFHEQELYNEIRTQYAHKTIVIANKRDLCKESPDQPIRADILVSAQEKEDVKRVYTILDNKVAHLFESIACSYLLNKRQYTLLLGLEKKLEEVATLLACDSIAYELIVVELNSALEHFTELTGKTISEAGMDRVFKEFCVGK